MIANKLLAQCVSAIGCITPPSFIPVGVTPEGELPGIMSLLNALLRVAFIVAGIWTIVNFILGGFNYMNAAGDQKKITEAWQKIWMSVLGLAMIVASFLIAAIVGMVLFGDPFALINPKLTR